MELIYLTKAMLTYDGAYKIKLDGHAKGSEKVCTAISSLCFALLGYLKNAKEVETKKSDYQSGKVDIEFVGGASAEAVFKMFCIGLLQIEKKYPKFIEVTVDIKA